MSFWVKIGLAPSKNDKLIRELVKNGYKTAHLVGRGTVKIDPEEIVKSSEFQTACANAKLIVKTN
ncbi:hypothetical protein [Delftia acidovorans]|uniref:hypothetical protein n=1 Tax=Delftia acidovorans TaxID=80866 RepID=UPI00192A98B1|nr:hypothetical protein [Delftia acidovorans]